MRIQNEPPLYSKRADIQLGKTKRESFFLKKKKVLNQADYNKEILLWGRSNLRTLIKVPKKLLYYKKQYLLWIKEESLAHCTGFGTKVLAKLSISHMQRQKVRYSFDRWLKRHNGKIGRTSFQIQISDVPLQSAVARLVVWHRRSKGYIKAVLWTVQTV